MVRAEAIEPELLFFFEGGFIVLGGNPAVADTLADGEDFPEEAARGSQIESALFLVAVLDKEHDVVMVGGGNLKTADRLFHHHELLDGNLVFVRGDPEQVSDVRWQKRIVALLEGLVNGARERALCLGCGVSLRIRSQCNGNDESNSDDAFHDG